jgi:hypothetical protein
MSEKKEIPKILGRVGIIVAFALLYCWGGMEMKWLRRFLAPAILCGGMFFYSRNWRALVQFPVMCAALCLGYGGTDLEWLKIVKRGVFGLANGAASSVSNFWNKRLLLGVFQVVLVTGATICFGVWNPFPNARIEEFVIGLLIAVVPVMSERAA